MAAALREVEVAEADDWLSLALLVDGHAATVGSVETPTPEQSSAANCSVSV